MDYEEYDLIKAASHETGHAVVHWAIGGSQGTARVWRSDNPDHKCWVGDFRSATMILAASVAGMVAEALFEPILPLTEPTQIIEAWKFYESTERGDTTALDANQLKRIKRNSIENKLATGPRRHCADRMLDK